MGPDAAGLAWQKGARSAAVATDRWDTDRWATDRWDTDRQDMDRWATGLSLGNDPID